MRLLFILLLISSKGFSYEWMFREGYTSCVACHYSVSGSGPLTHYGKMVSSGLSAWPKEFKPRTGALTLKGMVDYNVKLRLANVKSEFDSRTFPMQLDAAAVVQLDKLALITSIARAPTRGSDLRSGQRPAEIEKYYFRDLKARYILGGKNVFTFGRESQNLGLNLIDHTLFAKSLNRFNVTDLATVLSFDRVTSNLSYGLSLFAPNFQETDENRENGMKNRIIYSHGRHQVGLSTLYGKSKTINRGIVNLSHKFKWGPLLTMSEVYFTRRKTSQDVYFDQQTYFANIQYFIKDWLRPGVYGELVRRDTPFFLKQERLGASVWAKFTPRVSLQVDFKRSFYSASQENLYISQIYVNWW